MRPERGLPHVASPEILLTNDDGIDSPGIGALHDALTRVGDVTVVAPASNQSAVGRALSNDVEVREHALGHAVTGTPVDCVVAGMDAIGPFPDVVVSGCNKGANVGTYVLGRSGTVSAAVEAAFFGVPAIAASLYLPPARFAEETEPAQYSEAVEATAYLVEHALDCGVFEQADYLNVNAPLPGPGPTPMEITTPSHVYDTVARHDGERIVLHDRTWERMETGDLPDSPGTDRYAIAKGRVSVSPLTAPHTSERHESLDDLAERYG